MRHAQRNTDLPFQFQYNSVCFSVWSLALGGGWQEKEARQNEGWLSGTGHGWGKFGGRAKELKLRQFLCMS